MTIRSTNKLTHLLTYLLTYLLVGSVVQWLERRPLADRLPLIYA